MATGVEVLGLIFVVELVVILGLMVMNTYFLSRRPILMHLREIYFINSTAFRRAWYMVIAAMVFFLASRVALEGSALGLAPEGGAAEAVLLILFGSLIMAAFLEIVFIFAHYIRRFGEDEDKISNTIQDDLRAHVLEQDLAEGRHVDLSHNVDILESRTVLGPYVSIAHYRGIVMGVTQYLEDRFGELGDTILYTVGRQSGKNLGRELKGEVPGGPDNLLQAMLHELRLAAVGIATIVQDSPKRTNLRVAECAACSGMEARGKAQCHYLHGLFTGFFESLGAQDVQTREVKCWGKGDSFCEFQIDHEAIVNVPDEPAAAAVVSAP